MSDLSKLVPGPILPVIVIDDAKRAVPLAEALLAGGLDAIEITFRTAAAADAIKAIRDALPEMRVGAGTVLRMEQARKAVDAGAQFALSPGLNETTINGCRELGLPFIPGIATPSEIDRAYELGCTYLKFFPADIIGGAKGIKAMNAPYKHLGLRFCPTGGVSLKNMAEYLALPEVFALGGSWLATREQIANAEWSTVTQQVKDALAVAKR